MPDLCAINQTKKTRLAERIVVASSMGERCRGLLGKAALASGAGMWLTPCSSIHTFFMRFPIDALFLDGEGVVLYQKTFRPWTLSPWVRKAVGVLELPAGTLERSGTCRGDRVELKAA